MKLGETKNMKKRFLALALGTLAFGVTLGGVKMGFGHQDAMMVKVAETSKSVVFDSSLDKFSDTLTNEGVTISASILRRRVAISQFVTITLNTVFIKGM